MENKHRKHIGVDFDQDTPFKAAALMGVALFLRIAYYFGFTRLETAGFLSITAGLILPVLIGAGYIVLLRGLRFNAPGIYALMGVGLCLTLFLQSFLYAGLFRVFLGISFYLICGTAILGFAMGFLQNSVVYWLLILVAVGRVLFFNLFQNVFGLHFITLIPETAAVCELISLAILIKSIDR